MSKNVNVLIQTNKNKFTELDIEIDVEIVKLSFLWNDCCFTCLENPIKKNSNEREGLLGHNMASLNFHYNIGFSDEGSPKYIIFPFQNFVKSWDIELGTTQNHFYFCAEDNKLL